MRTSLVAAFVAALAGALGGAALAGCGAKSQIPGATGSHGTTGAGGSGGTSGSGGASVGEGSAGGAVGDASTDAPPAPTPVCTGANSACIYDKSQNTWSGASIINCAPVYYVGAWTLLLERQVGTAWITDQVQVVQEPGFGYQFSDMTGAPQELTYRVCVVDSYGTRCGDPFMTYGPVDCQCIPSTCDQLQLCNITVDNGCGHNLVCGACDNAAPCDTTYDSCCPAGEYGDGHGGCVCAPPKPCRGKSYWDTTVCGCVSSN
jgi:hypothetical protein